MSEPYIGEIRCFGFNFAPVNWAFCNGQLLSIAQNDALFSILGTTYGGDGVTTFALPNLQGRIPMHWGSNPPGRSSTQIGQVEGSTSVTLLVNQIPQHAHSIFGGDVTAGAVGENTAVPNAESYLSNSAPPNRVWKTDPTSFTAQFSPKAISPTGGSQPHENMQPYLALNFCIALFGIFPSRS
jgi:microcystin-dependent protein